MKVQIKISELIEQINGEYTRGIEPAEQPDMPLSTGRIHELVYTELKGAAQSAPLAKTENRDQICAAQQGGCEVIPKKRGGNANASQVGHAKAVPEKRFGMKRKSMLILVATMVLLLSATALAAGLGGLSFFRSIFGGSAGEVEGYMLDPQLTASSNGTTLCVESLLTDGYQLNLIVSLENSEIENVDALAHFTVAIEGKSYAGYASYELEEFAQDAKRYYTIRLASTEDLLGSDVRVGVDGLPLAVDVTLGEGLSTKAIAAQMQMNDNVQVTGIRISPMGFVLTAGEKVQQGGIPAPEVYVLYQNGKRELLLNDEYFDKAMDGALGGGGAVFSDEQRLAEEVQGVRNPKGEVVIMGQFTRILNLNEVRGLQVNGVEYRF